MSGERRQSRAPRTGPKLVHAYCQVFIHGEHGSIRGSCYYRYVRTVGRGGKVRISATLLDPDDCAVSSR